MLWRNSDVNTREGHLLQQSNGLMPRVVSITLIQAQGKTG